MVIECTLKCSPSDLNAFCFCQHYSCSCWVKFIHNRQLYLFTYKTGMLLVLILGSIKNLNINRNCNWPKIHPNNIQLQNTICAFSWPICFSSLSVSPSLQPTMHQLPSGLLVLPSSSSSSSSSSLGPGRPSAGRA